MSSPFCLQPSAPSERGLAQSPQVRARPELPLEGDVQSFYAAHFSLVWRSLRRLGVPEPQVEDAVQDVFLVAHRKFREYERRSAPSTWLYGIALRVAKDYRRAEVRRERRMARLIEEQAVQPVACEGPADALARKEANQLLHELLNLLSAEERDLLVLVDLEGLSVTEVAPLVGLRLRTCQRRLKSARKTFESALARHPVASHGGKR